MKIALAQMKMAQDLRDNLNASIRYIETAKSQNADLIFFPELQLSPFFPSKRAGDASRYLLEPDSAEIIEIRRACKENRLPASINIYLRENGKNFDASLMIDGSGNVLGISKMVHIASFPHFYETEYYTPSDTGFIVYDLPANGRICKIGVVICFDRHFPESIRSAALQGAELIIIPTANLTSEPEEMFLWELRVQAMQNCVCIAMCNRVGTESGITFCGRSVIVDHHGQIVSYADGTEKLLTGTVDLDMLQKDRINSPYFVSRRPEKYRIITQ